PSPPADGQTASDRAKDTWTAAGAWPSRGSASSWTGYDGCERRVSAAAPPLRPTGGAASRRPPVRLRPVAAPSRTEGAPTPRHRAGDRGDSSPTPSRRTSCDSSQLPLADRLRRPRDPQRRTEPSLPAHDARLLLRLRPQPQRRAGDGLGDLGPVPAVLGLGP